MSPAERVDGASAVVELKLAEARDFAWRLARLAEAEDLAAAVADLEAKGPAALDSGRAGLLAEHGLPQLLEWYGFAQSAGNQADLEVAFIALRPHSGDAELRALAARVEEALRLERGAALAVPAGEEAGVLYPFINAREYWPHFGHWETFQCDSAYPLAGNCIVVRPEAPEPGPAPVLVFLAGNATVDGRNSIFGGCFAALLQNEVIRKKFFVFSPMPTTRSGLIAYTGKGFAWGWSEDAVWSLVTQVMRKLGPERVDPGRIYFTGLSLGAQGTWRVACKYGRHIAAVIPISGQCDWQGDTWPSGSGPSEQVLENIRCVAMRAYHTDTDEYAGTPKKDIEWLTYDCYESNFDIEIAGLGVGEVRSNDFDLFGCLNHGGIFPFVKEEAADGQETLRRPRPEELKRLDVHARQWTRKWPHSPTELWWVKGPLFDLHSNGYNTSHMLHYRVYLNPLWGFTSFFLQHEVPEERRWRFDSEPFVADGSEHRRFVEESWGEKLFQGEEAEEERPKPLEPDGPLEEVWEVVGGEKEGGIIVRGGVALDSPQESDRLSTGALVVGLELRGQRLNYELRAGTGPQSGWVSTTSSKGKQLLTRSETLGPLTGHWELYGGEDEAYIATFTCWQKAGRDDFTGIVVGGANGDIQGSCRDGLVEIDFRNDHIVKCRLGQDGGRLEDAELVVDGSLWKRGYCTRVELLKRFHEPRGWKIRLVAAPPGLEGSLGWYLGAQRHLPRDRRTDFSSMAVLQRTLPEIGTFAEVEWELVQGSRPNRFKIWFKHAPGLVDFFLGPSFMAGWCLVAQNDREWLGKDRRDATSSYLSLADPKAWKDAKRAEWEITPGRTPGAYKLRLAEMPNSRDWIDGFYLAAMRFMNRDMRTERSTYAIMQSDSWEPAAEIEWEFEPGSAPGLRVIRLVNMQDIGIQEGWYLSAIRQLTSDKRNDDSTYVYIQAPIKNQKMAEWELIPTDEEHIFKIRLHSLPIQSAGSGWYLGAQCVEHPDQRNLDSCFASIQDASVWPGAAGAEWELHPTGKENVFRVQLRRMPHRGNRAGCWLNAVRATERDTRNDDSTWVSAIPADHWGGASGFEWAFER